MKKQILKSLVIVSGGQTGADRAALDFALRKKITSMGWCPAGRMAEDGPLSDRYPLKETPEAKPEERTRLNVRESDATLIIYKHDLDRGTRFCLAQAKDALKPVYIIHSKESMNPQEFWLWMEINKVKSLNIAGPRESNDKGVYDFTMKTLETIFQKDQIKKPA